MADAWWCRRACVDRADGCSSTEPVADPRPGAEPVHRERREWRYDGSLGGVDDSEQCESEACGAGSEKTHTQLHALDIDVGRRETRREGGRVGVHHTERGIS